MYREMKIVLLGAVLTACLATATPHSDATARCRGQASIPVQRIALAEQLAAGKLKPVNRGITKLKENRNAVHVDEIAGPGIVWIDSSDFAEATIDIDVRGRDVLQQSFVGTAPFIEKTTAPTRL